MGARHLTPVPLLSVTTQRPGEDRTNTMSTSFMTSPRFFFTSESVTEGHPDKMCDRISDAILDALLTVDPDARVACEVATTTGTVMVFGEISTTAYIDIDAVVRQTVLDIGYDSSHVGFDGLSCGVITSVKEQSADLQAGYERSSEAREPGAEVDPYDESGAGDQGMMIGFACRRDPRADATHHLPRTRLDDAPD